MKIWFENDKICIKTDEGKEASMPLLWFPRLDNATAQERNNFEYGPYDAHWPEIDEDISYAGFFFFEKRKVKQ